MMNYLELLHLDREPFSNSPDPESFYKTPTHELCLNQLEIAIRLKRGLNVVLGEVGTGKSTICRYLVRNLAHQDEIETFLLLDAGFSDNLSFATQLYELLSGHTLPEEYSLHQTLDAIQETIYQKALNQKHNLVLLIDEGQKLSADNLEILRELLNFETNTEKLLQIVIFAQPEFSQRIDSLPNFKDRINELLSLVPLSKKESAALMRHRLRLAGGQQAERLFSDSALLEVYKASQGRPRQLMRLGHQMLLALIMNNGCQVSSGMVKAQVSRNQLKPQKRHSWIPFLLLAVMIGAAWIWREPLKITLSPILGKIAISFQPEQQEVTAASLVQPPIQTTEETQQALSDPKEPPVSALATLPVVEPVAEPKAKDTPPLPDNTLGTMHLRAEDPLNRIAWMFYGTEEAIVALQKINADYVPGKEQDIQLPKLEFDVPPRLTKNFLVSFGVFSTANEAYSAWYSMPSLNLRIVARASDAASGEKSASTPITFWLLSRNSFSEAGSAWKWAASQKPSQDAVISLAAPYQEGEKSYYLFSR